MSERSERMGGANGGGGGVGERFDVTGGRAEAVEAEPGEQ
jgi:hypothetical protein